MRHKYFLTFILPAVVVAVQAFAASSAPPFIINHVPDAALSGTAHVQFMMIDLYDAKLYLSRGAQHSSAPLALSLSYLRALDGSAIADHAIEHIRNQGFDDEIKLAAWHEALAEIIPDVDENTTITGVLTAEGASLFYLNGKPIGKISDAEFGRRFFDIWLGRNPDEPIRLVYVTDGK